MRRWRDATQTIAGLRIQDAAAVTAGEERTGGDGIVGSRLGRYVILYRLGSGGMGVVFAAYDPELDRKVALKLVRLETGSPAAREALRREAQAMARLSHPNIVAVHDVGGEGRDVFLAMDLIDGVTLDEWQKLETRSWRDVLRLFVQAGRGLAAAHAAGVVHGDFSPRNVLVTAEETALIADFGLARALGGPDAGPADEAVRGTPAYLAPERLLGVAVDPRSDQFSFCAALYRALYGTVPFPADAPELYVERVGRGALEPPRDGRRVPRRLLALLRRGLDARPENRFTTMPELLGRLEAAARRPRVWRFAAAVPLVIAGIAGSVLLGRQDQASPPDRLAGVWSEAQRQSVRRALLRLDPAAGAQAAARLDSEIEAYAARWRAIDEDGHRAAIGDSGDGRGGTGLVRDRQRLCLDARRAELRALISRLETWQDRSLEPAVRAVQGLSDLGSCADVRVLRDLKTPPPDARIRRAMVPLQERLEEQFTLLETGGVPDLARVDRLVDEAVRLGYLPLILRAHEIRAAIRADRGAPGARADLEAALRAAVASADPIGQARMFGLLAKDVGLIEGRFADARLWRDLAGAGLAALGPGHEEIEVGVQQSLGAVALAEGDFREAARRYRRALDLAERLWGKEAVRLSQILSNLAVAVGGEEAGSQAAMAHLRRAGPPRPVWRSAIPPAIPPSSAGCGSPSPARSSGRSRAAPSGWPGRRSRIWAGAVPACSPCAPARPAGSKRSQSSGGRKGDSGARPLAGRDGQPHHETMHLLLRIHVAAGGLALVLGAVALVAKKGGTLHRRSGLLFVYAMLVMGFSASILAFRNSPADGNLVAGLLAAYFVGTALTAVRPVSPWTRRINAAALVVVVGLVLGFIVGGVAAFNSPGLSPGGVPLRTIG